MVDNHWGCIKRRLSDSQGDFVGALSERPSTSAGGRSESAPTGEPAGMPEAGKRFLLDFCYCPYENGLAERSNPESSYRYGEPLSASTCFISLAFCISQSFSGLAMLSNSEGE